MSDPLKFTWESMPAIWRCYYDPEGPCGEGKTKAKALEDLWSMCDDETGHREALLWGAIVASIPDVPSDVHGWRWIPVTERLPEPYTFVLAFSPCTNTERVNTARYTGRGGLKDGWITCMDHPVTHWMPLQEPCTARVTESAPYTGPERRAEFDKYGRPRDKVWDAARREWVPKQGTPGGTT